MWRRSFLIGNLTGLILGVLLMAAAASQHKPTDARRAPVMIPISTTSMESAENPRKRKIAPVEDRRQLSTMPNLNRHPVMNRSTMPNLHEPTPIPPEWTWKEFNGQRVYLIPLSMNETQTLR